MKAAAFFRYYIGHYSKEKGAFYSDQDEVSEDKFWAEVEQMTLQGYRKVHVGPPDQSMFALNDKLFVLCADLKVID